MLRTALACEPLVADKGRWQDAPDRFLAPFVEFNLTRSRTPKGCGGTHEVEVADDADGCIEEDDEEEDTVAMTVRMLVSFAAYVESAERRGVLPAAMDLAVIRPLLARNFMYMLPQSVVDGMGRRVLLTNLQSLVAVPEDGLERMLCWFFLHGCLDRSLAMPGLCVVYDLRGLRISDAYRLMRVDSSRLAPTGCFPIRPRRIILVNEPWWLDAFWSVCSRLMDSKMRRRVVFAGSDHKALHALIQKDGLPEELGGPPRPPAANGEAQGGWLTECMRRGNLLNLLAPEVQGMETVFV